jgi:hypothetical protein
MSKKTVKASPDNTATAAFKTETTKLIKALKQQGIDVSRGKGLEIYSIFKGFKDWNTASASLSTTTEMELPLTGWDLLNFIVDLTHSGTPFTIEIDGGKQGPLLFSLLSFYTSELEIFSKLNEYIHDREQQYKPWDSDDLSDASKDNDEDIVEFLHPCACSANDTTAFTAHEFLGLTRVPVEGGEGVAYWKDAAGIQYKFTLPSEGVQF